MSQHPIDKLFQQGLGKHKAAVPDSLWANIAADQEKKALKARNFKVAILSGSLLLVMLLGFLFWQYGQQPAMTADTQTVVAEQTNAESSILDETVTSNDKLTDAALKHQNTSLSNSQESEQITTSSFTNTSRVTAPSVAAVNDRNDNNWGTTQKSAQAITSSATDNPAPANEYISNDNQLKINDVVHSNDLPDLAIFSAPNVTEISPIATLPLPRLAPYERELPSVSAVASSTIRKRKKGIEVDLLGGFAYAHQVLSTDNEDNRNELNAREISEFPGLSYLAGLRVSYRLNDHFSLRSGLSYGQIRNQFEYDQMVNFGTDSMKTLLIRSNNQIRILEVPLLLGYELPGKRFRLAINAGPILNISTKATGRYLLPNQQRPVLLEENNIYRSNIGLGWQGSLTAAYNLGGGNSLLIEPTFKSYPRSITNGDYSLKERYWMAGLQIGLRHRLQ